MASPRDAVALLNPLSYDSPRPLGVLKEMDPRCPRVAGPVSFSLQDRISGSHLGCGGPGIADRFSTGYSFQFDHGAPSRRGKSRPAADGIQTDPLEECIPSCLGVDSSLSNAVMAMLCVDRASVDARLRTWSHPWALVFRKKQQQRQQPPSKPLDRKTNTSTESARSMTAHRRPSWRPLPLTISPLYNDNALEYYVLYNQDFCSITYALRNIVR